tara:strand:+ start:1053 stop:1310 length:258 start_codon:yes stop_codon:yes gene_type:complete
MIKPEYDFSPMREFMETQAGPEELAGYLDTLEEKLVNYMLTDEHAGLPVGNETEWYYLRQLRKIMEKMAIAHRAEERFKETLRNK